MNARQVGIAVRTRAGALWRDWLRTLLLVLLVIGSFRSAVADWNDVPTGSMKPTILEGDRIFVNKLAYGLRVPFTPWFLTDWRQPQRGDIVVLFSPSDGTRLVKRVVGLPGDRVAMRNDRLFVNGVGARYAPLDAATGADLADRERRIFAAERVGERTHTVMITPGVAAMRSFGPLEVPAEHYYLLGDNRDESGDSRYFGVVPRERIVGRAIGVAASLDPARYYAPRWHRFFRGLD